MRQPRFMSLLESVANVAVGYSVATGANLLVLPLFGFHPGLREAAGIGGILTIISIVRSYLLRRLFDFIHHRSL